MILPRTFQLGPHQWTVKTHSGLILDGSDECNGLCDFRELTIHVNTDQPGTMVRHSFMHEVMHAVLWTLGRNELCENEDLVDSMGAALVQVFDSAKVW